MASLAKQSVVSGLSSLAMRIAVGKAADEQPMPFMAEGKLLTLSQCKSPSGRIYSSPIEALPKGPALPRLAAISRGAARAFAQIRAIGEYDSARTR